jgi:mono/diheme cytochrome c family protein
MQRGISARLTGRYAPRMNVPHSTPARRDAQRPTPQQGEAPAAPRRDQWVRGSVASWGLGVTLGLILGVGLLIATPQLMGKPAEATPASTAPANANENGPADAGKSDTGTGEDSMASGEGMASGGTAGEGASGEADSGDMAAGQGASSAAGEAAAGGTPDTAAGDTEAAGDAQAGQTVFAGNCAGCHGANGQGQIGPSLVTTDGPRSWTLAQFATTLREGKTPERELSATMPRYGEAQISDAQVADLHAYIKTLN